MTEKRYTFADLLKTQPANKEQKLEKLPNQADLKLVLSQDKKIDEIPISDQKLDQKADLNLISDQMINDQSIKKSENIDKNTQTPLNDYPVSITYPVYDIPGIPQTPGIPNIPGISETPGKGYLQVPHEISDIVFPSLTPYELAIYYRLYRLSYGFKKSTCHLSLSTLAKTTNCDKQMVRKALRSLTTKGLVIIEKVENSGTITGGTHFRVYQKLGEAFNQTPGISNIPGIPQIPGILETPGIPNTPGIYNIPNIIDDDDPLKERSSSKENDDDKIFHTQHYLQTKQIYETLTGNSFNKSDREAYKKLENVNIEVIKETIKVVKERANSTPNSLNFFVKEILKVSDPRSKTRTQQRKQLEKIIKDVQAAYIGSKPSIADICGSVKRRCVNEGVIYDNDLFNKIMGI